jgi:hypothetical protein
MFPSCNLVLHDDRLFSECVVPTPADVAHIPRAKCMTQSWDYLRRRTLMQWTFILPGAVANC